MPTSGSAGRGPAKARGGRGYDPAPGSIVRGTRCRLYPKRPQAALFDLWRRRTRELWNLLVGLEQAAYSGRKHMPHLKWREIWADVARINHELALDRRQKRIDDGKEPGPEPKAPDVTPILARRLGSEPQLFIWENDLQKIMARLKAVPWTRWIGELPSHAAQHVVKDVIKALQAMVREKKKRTAGAGGRNIGFPKFKANRYATGSVYFANTQITFDFDRSRIRFPGGVGWVKFAGSGIEKGNKLMGARIWRQGEQWWISPQFEMPAQAALPMTGRTVGVKVAAATLATIYDGRSFEQTTTPRPDKRAQRRLKLWSRKLSRRLDAQVERARKIRRRNKNARRGKKGMGPKIGRSAGFLEGSAELSQRQAHEAAQRNDLLHKLSRSIVDGADHIAIERLDVAGMLARADHVAEKRRRRALRLAVGAKDDKPAHHRAPHRVLRKAVRRAAMARLLAYIRYKGEDGGRTITETHVLFPRVQACGARLDDGTICGHLNMAMKDGRMRDVCKKCGKVMHRNPNAAENLHASGLASSNSGLEAAE